MKKILFMVSLLFSVGAISQSDSIFLHNGKTIIGNVVRNAEFTVLFKYVGEDAEQVLSKYAVSKIIYGKSHRVENITDKIVIASKDDWEKVVILVDKTEIAGLTKVDDVKGKTALINARTPSGGNVKALRDIKQKAAEKGCPFILILTDKDTHFTRHSSSSMSNSVKTGAAYKY